MGELPKSKFGPPKLKVWLIEFNHGTGVWANGRVDETMDDEQNERASEQH